MIATTNSIRDYLTELSDLLKSVKPDELELLVDALYRAWMHGNRVILMGNGGSGGSASHIVADMQKTVQFATGKALRAICLTDSTALITALANDTEYSNIFAPQVECWAEPGDVVIAVSGSGNSKNIIKGVEAANRMGAFSFGLAGYHGGELKSTAQHCLVVPSSNMQQIEDVHISLLHAVILALLDRVSARDES